MFIRFSLFPRKSLTSPKAVQAILGIEQVHAAEPSMAAEDFSYMANVVPACYLNLGVANPNWERVYPVHTADFRLDETALPVGAAALAGAVLEWMRRNPEANS